MMGRITKTVIFVAAFALFVCGMAGADDKEERQSESAVVILQQDDVVAKKAADRGHYAMPVGTDLPGGRSGGGLFGLQSCFGQMVSGGATEGSQVLRAGFLAAVDTVNTSLIFADGFETGGTGEWDSTAGSSP